MKKNDHPDGVLGFSALPEKILAAAHRDYTFPACRSYYVRNTGSSPIYLHCFLVHLSGTPSHGHAENGLIYESAAHIACPCVQRGKRQE